MKRFALFGTPVAHSLSPFIHQSFANSLGISLVYERILTPKGQLKEMLQQFREQGGIGANITVPLKQEAFQLCAQLTQAAKEAMAVNTLYWEGETLCGDNTDGEGFVRDLTQNLGCRLQDKRILILGAGGAASGILKPLLACRPSAMVIVNRTWQKALALAKRDPLIKSYDYESLQSTHEAPFDFVFNATSCSLQDIMMPLAPKWIEGVTAIDLAYQKHQKTIFQQWAMLHGASQSYDGIGMLVEQAALAFKRWHGVEPITRPVMERIRQGDTL
ncbi:MAG: shikimate dehydrogenase [Gammaproteobacteria bacterium 39-13]|nr:shikimate dehydrogenase [Gammaproteobacteria bacterium]OJV88273.1 MAG: shikimate dehydrogenase [Gammaproteobacteria bacterium 39-13]